MSSIIRRKVKNGLLVNPSQEIEVSRSADLDIYKPADDRDLKIILDRAVTEDDWENLFRKFLDIALGGGMVGVKAGEFLAKYRWGMPATITVNQTNAQAPITIVEIVRPAVEARTEETEPEESKPSLSNDKFDREAEAEKDDPF